MNFARIDRGRTLDPEEISTCGNCHAISRREMPAHGFQYNRLLIRCSEPHATAGRIAISVQGDIT